MPPQPIAFFLNIHRHLIAAGLGFLITAKHKQKPVAAALFLKWGRQAFYKFGASDESFQELRGTNGVMWAAIQKCIGLRLERLHLGRTSLGNNGLRRFKLGWGAMEQSLSYLKFDLRRNEFACGADRASGWHNRVFGKLPPPLLRLAGKLLYPHLA